MTQRPKLGFYAPGRDYHALLGKDATRGIALLSLEEQDLTDDIVRNAIPP